MNALGRQSSARLRVFQSVMLKPLDGITVRPCGAMYGTRGSLPAQNPSSGFVFQVLQHQTRFLSSAPNI
jgi:hypothetical protein